MENLDYEFCPVCGARLTTDSTLFANDEDILGCDECITAFSPSLINDDYENFLWTLAKEEKAGIT